MSDEPDPPEHLRPQRPDPPQLDRAALLWWAEQEQTDSEIDPRGSEFQAETARIVEETNL